MSSGAALRDADREGSRMRDDVATFRHRRRGQQQMPDDRRSAERQTVRSRVLLTKEGRQMSKSPGMSVQAHPRTRRVQGESRDLGIEGFA